MKAPEIVVLSGENRLDQYGNFLFKDMAGAEHKIGANRKDKAKIESIVVAHRGRAVTLVWGEYNNKDYIKEVNLVEDVLPESVPASSEPSLYVPQIDTPPSKSREDAIREGMWWKELGECLRSGLIDRATPAGKLLERFYKAEMQSVLGFKIEKGGEEH